MRWLLLAACVLAITLGNISSDLVFFNPGKERSRFTMMKLGDPGLSSQGDTYFPGEQNLREINGRDAIAQGPRLKTVEVYPVCLACQCQVGFKSCAEAGGRMWIASLCSKTPGGSPTDGDECSYPAPSTLSVCEPSCVFSCTSSGLFTRPALEKCKPLDGFLKKQCGTPCERASKGTIVQCNSAYANVISSVPGPCHHHENRNRYKRSTLNDSLIPAAAANLPEIQSSYEDTPDRSSRALRLNLKPLPPLWRANYRPVTNFVRARFTATYVSPENSCLPGNIADAPMCSF